MGLFQNAKPKSAGKVMIPIGDSLTNLVLDTLRHMAKMAEVTLGPGGRQVLIERSEMNMKPLITKDGVTVIKSLGYQNPVQQLILESARDAALRTASEAGDGTTTATILSSAIVESTQGVISEFPKISPQRIVRELYKLAPYLKNKIKEYKIDITGDNYADVLLKVATLSANGDVDLSKAVLEAFDVVGEEGNLTIIEATGESRYQVERISGYTVDVGYEESCKKFSQGFINDRSGTLVGLERPIFLLYDGVINDLSQIFDGLQKITAYFDEVGTSHKNVVLVAHGFSDIVLGDLHVNWNHPQTMNVFPLLTPQSAILNWRTHFLYDLQAYTGSPVFNPIDRPVSDLDAKALFESNLVKAFESGRFRSSVISQEDPALIEARVEELKLQLLKPESQYEANDLQVRIGKLTSGIARLNIYAPSQGECREKRDRAEDAWMAIKGTIKYGACPGGGYVLVRLAADLVANADRVKNLPQSIAAKILAQAFLKPVQILYKNYGYVDDEIELQMQEMLRKDEEVFDIAEQKWVSKYDLLDSVPAVSEAIENSISIASLLGTLGGIVSFGRSDVADKEELKGAADFERAITEK